ncbi:MAG: hypothetical protein JWN04_1359 [Myxococcaceae bacterium]|nr:hypothetical protein [Myxococcaceae bacterium]
MRNPVHRELARLMTQMRRLCTLTLNKRLSVVGCSVHEYAVLCRLATDSEVPQHELAYDAAIDPAAVSRLVQSMSRAGLVTTHVHSADKRQRFVKLTSKGRTLERTLSPVVDDALEPLLSGLDAAEEQHFVGLLRRAYEHAVSASDGVESDAPRASKEGPSARAPLAASVRPKRVTRRRLG